MKIIMRTLAITLLSMCFAALVFAVYNESKHQIFVERESNLMYQMQDSREECDRLVSQWFTEAISTDPAFVDHDSGITTDEMTSVITYCQDFEAFNENAAVGTADRQTTIDPFLGTRVR